MKKLLILLLLGIFLAPQMVFAGAWTLPKKNIWAEHTMKWLYAKDGFSSNCDRYRFPRDARSWGWVMADKIEYGVLDWITVLAGLEYKEMKWKEYDRPASWGPYRVKNHGLSNVEYGVKVRLIKEPVVASIQIKHQIYPRKGYDANSRAPVLSDRADKLELRGMVGKVFDEYLVPFYVNMESGYRWKNRDACNDIPFLIEGGFWLWKFLLIKSEIDGYWTDGATGKDKTSYAVWRVGPVLQLYDLYHMIRGKDVTSKEYLNDVTRQGKSFNIEMQYGNTFWGRNSTAYQEAVIKASIQFSF